LRSTRVITKSSSRIHTRARWQFSMERTERYSEA